MENLDTFSFVYLIASSLCGLTALLVFPKLKDELKILAALFITSAGVDIITIIFSSHGQNNLTFFHIYLLVELVLLGKIFLNLYDKRGINLPHNLILGIGVALLLINTIFFEPIDTFNIKAGTTVSFIFLFANIYFFSLLVGENESSLFESALKWIMIAIFLYHCVSLLYIFMYKLIANLDEFNYQKVSNGRTAVLIIARTTVMIQFLRILIQKPQK